MDVTWTLQGDKHESQILKILLRYLKILTLCNVCSVHHVRGIMSALRGEGGVQYIGAIS